LPLPILLLRKRKLLHSLGRPSRSDFVQLEINGGYKKMKNGIHGNREQLEELSVNRILGELYDKAKAENDGKFHIREIEDGHVGDTIELY
jgi:hypothetical protein